MGESLSTIQKLDTPLEQATTPSLEALKAYSVGIRIFYETGFAAAILLYDHRTGKSPAAGKFHNSVPMPEDSNSASYLFQIPASLFAERFRKGYNVVVRIGVTL